MTTLAGAHQTDERRGAAFDASRFCTLWIYIVGAIGVGWVALIALNAL